MERLMFHIEEDQYHRIKNLLCAIGVLAMEPDVQISMFPDYVPAAYEIASTFCDCLDSALPPLERSRAPEEFVAECRAIYEILDRAIVERDEDMLINQALRSDVRWARLRTRAADIIRTFEIPPEYCTLDWIRFQQ
jgi:hypothetical protein